MRFIQIYSGGAHNDDNWDAHTDIVKNHTKHAGDTDKPIAGPDQGPEAARAARLDARSSGAASSAASRPPNTLRAPAAITTLTGSRCGWPAAASRAASASARPTSSARAAVKDRYHVKNLHATILTQLGLDPNRLSYFYGGLDQKLVGVEGAEPIKQII